MAHPRADTRPTEKENERSEAKQRICYFVHSGGVGGATLSLLYLLQQMDRDRYEPTVVFLTESPLRQAFQDLGVETMVARRMSYFSHTTGESLSLRNPRGWLQVPMFLPSVLQTYRLVKRLRPHIVHLNSSTLAPQAIGAKLAGAKVVWHIREPILDGLIGARKTLLRWVASHCVDAIAVILRHDVQRMGAPEKSHVIYNFVDFNVFDRSLRDRYLEGLEGKEPLPKTVVMLGGVSQVKGTRELVEAYPLVREKVGPVRFLIAGYHGRDILSGGQSLLRRWLRRALGRDRYLRQVLAYVDNHCGDGVVFTGVVNDVPALLADTDLVVFPSTAPHFPRPIVEAGAMAIPVVASDVEGPREVIRHGETGLLVPPGDPMALAEAIARVLSDEALASALSEGGYAQASRLFRAKTNSQATFAIYERLLQGNAVATPADAPGPAGHSEQPQLAHGRISRTWAILFLGWLVALFGVYFYRMLTIPGRWEKFLTFIDKVFG